MRLLLDENLPKRLKQDYPDHDVSTVRDQGWNGLKNGMLLKALTAAGFDALLTFDKNLQFQQNFKGYTIAVIVLQAPINTYQVLTRLSDQVNHLLSQNPLPIGVTVIAEE